MLQLNDLHWLAGLLEGEGCFRWQPARKSQHSGVPVVFVGMTDRDVIDRAASVLGATQAVRVEPRRAGWKTVYRIEVHGRRAAGWMQTLYPLLGVRRQAAIRVALGRWRNTGAVPNLPPLCHPKRKHEGNRLCKSCYNGVRLGRIPRAVARLGSEIEAA